MTTDSHSQVACYDKFDLELSDQKNSAKKCADQLRFFQNCKAVIENADNEQKKQELKTACAVCMRYATNFNNKKMAFIQFHQDVYKDGLSLYCALDRMELQLQLLMDNVSGYCGKGLIDDRQNLIRERKMRLKYALAVDPRQPYRRVN